MVLIEEFSFDSSQLIEPPDTVVHIPITNGDIPLVTPVNYSSTNTFIIHNHASVSPQAMFQNMDKLTISPVP